MIGDIEAGTDGRAEFRFINNRMKVWEMIGRSMIVHDATTAVLPQINMPETRYENLRVTFLIPLTTCIII